jgi:hypothetical protein
MNGDRAAWNLYWATFAVLVIALAGFFAARGTGILWGLAVAAPLFAAGLNLVLRSAAHSRVCAIEVERHAWLRTLTMGGYRQRTFFTRGVLEIVAAIALGAWIAAR